MGYEQVGTHGDTMGTLVALVLLLSCGPPENAYDCARRCRACEPSCVQDRGSFPRPDEECDEECNVANDMWVCDVEEGECVVMWF